MEIGAKIHKLRKAKGLTLQELASRSELTKGFLSQVERDLTSPSISTLEDILEALGCSLSEFFQEETSSQIVFGQDDFFIDEKDDHTICYVVPNAQKNQLEPILVTIPPKGRSMEVDIHPGEEFGYVLKGSVYLCMEDGSRHRLKSQETFSISGAQKHWLANPFASAAVVLWVSTPPIF